MRHYSLAAHGFSAGTDCLGADAEKRANADAAKIAAAEARKQKLAQEQEARRSRLDRKPPEQTATPTVVTTEEDPETARPRPDPLLRDASIRSQESNLPIIVEEDLTDTDESSEPGSPRPPPDVEAASTSSKKQLPCADTKRCVVS